MANVQLNFTTKLSTDNKTVSFYELTGAYDVDDNPNGWGLPNDELSGATDGDVLITTPSGTLYTVSITNAGFPTDDVNIVAAITMEDLGGSSDDEFVDGVYIFEYRVTMGDDSARTISRYVFLYGQAKCCVTNMFANLDVINCNSKDTEAVQKASEAYTFYKAMKYAAACGQVERANRLLSYVNKLCNNYGNCKDC